MPSSASAECSAPDQDDRRRLARAATAVEAVVRQFGGAGVSCQVRDFSPQGCRLHGCSFSPGAEVWIKFAGVDAVRARVVWAHSGLAGCRFGEPLSPLMIALARLQPDES